MCLFVSTFLKRISIVNISTRSPCPSNSPKLQRPPDQKIPDWCSDLEDVFSETTHNVLPPYRPYDHTIDLKPTFVPKIAKVYPLNPKEQEACKAFINEHLKTG